MSGEVKKSIVIATLVMASQLLVASMPTFEEDDMMMGQVEQVIEPEQAPALESMPTFSDEEQGQIEARPELEEPLTKEAYVEMSPGETEHIDVAAEQPQDDQDDSGLSGGEIAGIAVGAAAGAAALGAAAMMGKSAYNRRKTSVPAAEAPRTQIPTSPVGDQYRRQTPPPPVAPRVRPPAPEDTLARLQRQGAVSVSPLNAPPKRTPPQAPAKPAWMQQKEMQQARVNVEPQDRVVKGFDPEKTAKAPLSGAEKITVHKTVPGSQPAEQKRSTFGSFMRGRR